MLDHPLSSILLVTLVTFLAVLVIPGQRPWLIKWASLAGGFVTLLISVAAWARYDTALGGFQFTEVYPWMPTLGIDWRLGVDGFSLPLLTLNAIVFFTGVLSMWELKLRVKEYFALMILLVLGVSGVFMALDLFAFFFFYEVAVLPMYLLIAIWGSGPREYAAMKLTLYLMAGSALLFPALLAIYFEAGLGTCDMQALGRVAFDPHFQRFVYPFLYIGFGVLAGMWPFHNWSPSGHSAAPTAVSMLHAGVLMKLGAFGILAVGMRLLPAGAQAWAGTFAVLATVNIIYGAFVALRQADLKFVVGFSSVSHMGIVLLGLNLALMGVDRMNALNGAVLQMFCHGAMTALFFSTIGYIYDRTHTKLIAEWGGMARTLPRAATFFILAGLCGIGLPGLASFWAELLVFLAALRTMPVVGVLIIVGLVFTAIYMLRVFETAFFGPQRERWAALAGDDMRGLALVPRVFLACVLLVFGFAPQWLLGLINSASLRFFER